MNRENTIQQCFVCQLNENKKFKVEETALWQVDVSPDIKLNGLFFLKTKRHVEHIADLTKLEALELGEQLKKYSRESKKIAGAERVLHLCLGLKEPHVHFWIIPVVKENVDEVKNISEAVKSLANKFREK